MGKQHGIGLKMSYTKIGMGSSLMRNLTAKQIEHGVTTFN
jgi:hypothetical protein